MSSTSFLNTMLHGFGTFLTFAIEVTLLVVALTTVKPKRPDAFMPLVGGAVLHLFGTVMWSIFTTLAPSILPVSSLAGVYSVGGFFMTLIHVAGWAAIILGVYKLASGPSSPFGPPGGMGGPPGGMGGPPGGFPYGPPRS